MHHEQQLSKTRSIGPNFPTLRLIVFTLVVLLAICVFSHTAVAAPARGKALTDAKTSVGVKDSSCNGSVCTCTGGALPNGTGEDLIITTGTCIASAGTYKFHNVNIYGGGQLMFMDNGDTDFWAESILIENLGSLNAGTSDVPYGVNGTLTIHLYGADQGVAGKGGAGITCKADSKNQCGVPDAIWNSNPGMMLNPSTCNLSSLPGGMYHGDTMTWSNPVSDCFYAYMPLDFDGGASGNPPLVGYFGYKVLAVSYGGTLQLFGTKGAVTDDPLQHPETSGTSWARLTSTLAGKKNETSFTIDRPVNWKQNDQIVITTTDYLPGHSEVLTLASDAVTQNGITTITVKDPGVVNPHYGETYSLTDKNIPNGVGPDTPYIDTRAAVGLLTRSIQIVSGGDKLLQDFPAPPPPVTQDPYDCSKGDNPGYYFGGHAVFRQGFAEVQIRGVEFYQMGQGGRIMHYPVHFHMARKTPQAAPGNPPLTFIEDSSVWDSMTRWIVLHASHGVTLARNVGYLSIGHGYYLEDATEINNQLYSNLGVFARAAVKNPQNPRQVPGILAAAYQYPGPVNRERVPYHSDIDHPAVFWITNGWNDFQYNQAAGAGTCGTCYWLVSAANSGMSRYEKWWSYASEQRWVHDDLTQAGNNLDYAGMTPLEKFKGNACTTAMASFLTITDTQACEGVVPAVKPPPPAPTFPRLCPVTKGVLAPAQPLPGNLISIGADAYYPKVDSGGDRYATQCPPGDMVDCSMVKRCTSGDAACEATVLDHYTTSFNWAAFNFSAIWLRPLWYLVSNSNITDVQAGGLSFVTGGGYTESDEIQGHWGIARNNAFVGQTQPTFAKGGNPYASDAGPFNPDSGLSCALQSDGKSAISSFCLDANEGIVLSLSNFNGNQRLFSIYDGPAYQENNAYLDITHTKIDYCHPGSCTNGTCTPGGCQVNPGPYPYALVSGMPADANSQCYLPNAAIGWKQPNGFYYPPAFHSKNLFFDNVEIRHFVIEPLFHLGTFDTDFSKVAPRYCTGSGADGYFGLFNGFTDIDRQTELNDDDGSLTGLINTISVNKDPFFNAPVEDLECASDVPSNMPPNCDKTSDTCGTAKTSPYDFVTTVVYPDCGHNCPVWLSPPPGCTPPDCPTPLPPGWPPPDWVHWWAQTCSTPQCYGVPLYRQDLNFGETGMPFIRMAGQSTAQRSTLTVNHGTYYIDTTVSEKTQRQFVAEQMAGPAYVNVFVGGHTYYTFLLYAKSTAKQTYQMYVVGSKDHPFDPDTDVVAVRAHTETDPPTFDDQNVMWPSTWSKSYDKNTGILTVTMDMNFDEFKTNYGNAAEYDCQPATFCSWNSGSKSCGCALDQSDSLYRQCQAVCSDWTQKDVKCPIEIKDGKMVNSCYGFGVKFPNSWVAKDQQGVRPATACYPNNDDWNVKFQTNQDAGSCTYKNPPPLGLFCPQ